MKKIFIVMVCMSLVACTGNSTKQKESEEIDRRVDSIIQQKQQDYQKQQADAAKDNKSKKSTSERDEFVGEYYCDRSGDTYVFRSTNFGEFTPRGAEVGSSFYWVKKGDKVIIKYVGDAESFGSTKLTYKKKSHQLIEKSKLYGTLVYEKEDEF